MDNSNVVYTVEYYAATESQNPVICDTWIDLEDTV
jgi:hypothetical protein